MKDYEKNGIPDNAWLEYDEPPDFAVIFDDNEVDDPFDCPFGLAPGDLRLWVEADYWTALEAALLLAGVAPDDTELYAVGQVSSADDGFGNKMSNWKYAPVFHHAKEYLFLFERSTLFPKALPFEWVKYFYSKVNKIYVRGFKESTEDYDYYRGGEWLKFFSDDLNNINQTNNPKKPESTRKTENLLRALTAIAIDAYDYNPKDTKSNTPQEIVDALSLRKVNFDPKTVRGWLKEGASLLEINSDKD